MKHRLLITISFLFLLTACDIYQPIKVGSFALRLEQEVIFAGKTQPICKAIEDAGYIMFYGPPYDWYKFNVTQSTYRLDTPIGSLLQIPVSDPYLYMLVNWSIPIDNEHLNDGASQETINSLGLEVKNICQIVQSQAEKQGIPKLKLRVSLVDLIGGTILEYDGGKGKPISNCDQIRGNNIGRSIGMNPQGRTPNMCPSLYVPG
jgi:hypothetical protein